MRDGNSGGQGRRQRRSDAGYDFAGNSPFPQMERLLGAAAEKEGISAFEPDHGLSGPGQANQQTVNFRLRKRKVPAALPHIDQLGVGSRLVEEPRIHKAVVDDGVGPADRPQSSERDQLRVSRPRAYE